MRITTAMVQVAAALMRDPDGPHWGYTLSRESGVRSGVMYPILRRMMDEGWLSDGWEDAADAQAEGRPPRRFYSITETGMAELGALRAKVTNDARFRGLDLGWAG